MSIKKCLGFGFPSLLATSLILAPGVQAEEVRYEVAQKETQSSTGNFSVTNLDGGLNNNNLSLLFNRAFYHNTGRFYEITNISGQANNIFGARTFPGSFLDNQIAKDAKLVETLFYFFLHEEMRKPTIKTKDLPNPYDSSIQEDPSYLGR
ncbi:hypothetical protein C7H19_21285 [Aphanothece hegewaldii CCALA 016]|uniref:Porin n=1 Tax=Aphanothece hegewaldii CCALA 016 TaxID=2107694 RepID=A0A2T1LSC8_9CHRO|nr:hypothetical protein [Aphanothece hegewaldii]PSF32662.1 hypothetical protein C7H19_21285 [Aphanothece hegewaldii CCALA 016]